MNNPNEHFSIEFFAYVLIKCKIPQFFDEKQQRGKEKLVVNE